LKDFEFSRPTMELRWQGLADARMTLQASPWISDQKQPGIIERVGPHGASPISCEAQRLSHSLFVSGGFAMIYVVDAKFFESTAGDTDRCPESPPGVVRDGARVNSPEPVMRRLPRRKVK
jgi:hypothetical protein